MAPAAQNDHNEEEMEMDSPSNQQAGDALADKTSEASVPFVPRQPMGALMSAPPEGGSYPSLEAVHKFVLSYCTSVGYAVVIGRSKKTVPGLKKVLFVCDRAGKPPRRVNPEQRKRKTTSRKCDCQFGFFAIEQRTQWTVRYRPDTSHLSHNHGPSESPVLHPAARKLDSTMVAAVKALKDDGALPASNPTATTTTKPRAKPKPKATTRKKGAASAGVEAVTEEEMGELSGAIPESANGSNASVTGVGVSETLEILQTENPHVPLLPRDIYNARAAITRNPTKVATGIAENRPAIYSKPQTTADERIKSDLRRELAQAKEELRNLQEEKQEQQKELDELKRKLDEKNKVIQRFEMFIDICNQRVILQRERLSDNDGVGGPNLAA